MYWLIFGFFMILSLIVQARLKSKVRKYSNLRSQTCSLKTRNILTFKPLPLMGERLRK